MTNTLHNSKILFNPIDDNFCTELIIPADKSLSHRALILNALAKGPALIGNLLCSQDVLSTLDVLIQLGAEIVRESDRVEIKSITGIQILMLLQK